VEHFKSLLEAAVMDRLRTDRAGILLSGGLDTSSVAAVAKEISAKGAPTTDIRCYTHIFDSFSSDREGEYAREVGEFLRLPVKCMALDQIQLFEGWDDPEFSLPEPVDDPLFAGFLDTCRAISADCRVQLKPANSGSSNGSGRLNSGSSQPSKSWIWSKA